jgi:hypothetical protein
LLHPPPHLTLSLGPERNTLAVGWVGGWLARVGGLDVQRRLARLPPHPKQNMLRGQRLKLNSGISLVEQSRSYNLPFITSQLRAVG